MNYIFVIRLHFGIKGSALATACGQTFSTIWVMRYFLFGPSLLKIHIRNFRLRRELVFSIMAIGFAPFAMQLANCLQNTILNKALMTHGGDMALSAMGIIGSVGTLMFMPVLGISQGVQPIIGYNYGARQFGRVREALKLAVIVATIIAVTSTIVIHIWPMQIASLFSTNKQLTRLTAHAMSVFFAMFIVAGFQIVCSNYFQAVGKPIQATILGLSRQLLLLVPLLVILPRFWGIEGVWRTPPIADILSATLTATLIYREMRHMKESEKARAAAIGNAAFDES